MAATDQRGAPAPVVAAETRGRRCVLWGEPRTSAFQCMPVSSFLHCPRPSEDSAPASAPGVAHSALPLMPTGSETLLVLRVSACALQHALTRSTNAHSSPCHSLLPRCPCHSLPPNCCQ